VINVKGSAHSHLLVQSAPRDGPFQLGGLLLLQVQGRALGAQKVGDLIHAKVHIISSGRVGEVSIVS
jgi:hypothetical protein